MGEDEGLRQAREYIQRIRNPALREYAERYLAWFCHEYGPQPEVGPVSKLAAHHVRTQIRERLRG